MSRSSSLKALLLGLASSQPQRFKRLQCRPIEASSKSKRGEEESDVSACSLAQQKGKAVQARERAEAQGARLKEQRTKGQSSRKRRAQPQRETEAGEGFRRLPRFPRLQCMTSPQKLEIQKRKTRGRRALQSESENQITSNTRKVQDRDQLAEKSKKAEKMRKKQQKRKQKER